MTTIFKQAAVLQSAILKIAEAEPQPITVNDLLDKARIQELQAKKEQVWTALKSLHTRGLLTRVSVKRPGDPAFYAYEIPKGGITKGGKPAGTETKPITTTKLDIVVGKRGDYAELTLQGLRIRISIGE